MEETQIDKIQKALGELKTKTPNVLKKAINDTAKQTRMKLGNKAKEKYAVKKSGFNKDMTIKNATVGRLEATIKTKGEAMEVGQFRASPFRVTNGKNRPKSIKAKVLTSSSMKELIKGDTKAFVTKFKSGHVAVVERVPSKQMKSNPKKEFLKKLLSPSTPQMIGSKKYVYGEIQPEIQSLLEKNIQKQIQKVLEGR